jgi:hypothetical protein
MACKARANRVRTRWFPCQSRRRPSKAARRTRFSMYHPPRPAGSRPRLPCLARRQAAARGSRCRRGSCLWAAFPVRAPGLAGLRTGSHLIQDAGAGPVAQRRRDETGRLVGKFVILVTEEQSRQQCCTAFASARVASKTIRVTSAQGLPLGPSPLGRRKANSKSSIQ